MKFIRYAKGQTQYRGILDGNIIKRINGTIFHDYSLSAETENINDVVILPPVLPSKIIISPTSHFLKKLSEIAIPARPQKTTTRCSVMVRKLTAPNIAA